ncbi:MAG: toxin-antitoxin system PIN domain toxin, partial [Verrucomicrobiales bacterium]
MIIPDANLLLYAYDSSSPFHDRARAWWEGCLNGDEAVDLCHAVVFAFVRLSTNPRVFSWPLSPSRSFEIIGQWLARRNVSEIVPGADHLQAVNGLLEKSGAAGNLVTDAQIAALALQYGATVHSADPDFARFPGGEVFESYSIEIGIAAPAIFFKNLEECLEIRSRHRSGEPLLDILGSLGSGGRCGRVGVCARV